MIRRMTKLKNSIEKGVTDLRQPTLSPVNFTVSPEMLSQSDTIDTNKEHMKEIVKLMKKQAKATESDLHASSHLSEVFEAYAKSVYTQNATSPASSCLRDAASVEQKLSDLAAKREEKIQQVLCTTMESYVTDGIKPAIEKKKQYDRDAMDYDAMITKHKSLKKSGKATPAKEKESEQQLNEMRDQYTSIEKETLELLKQANLKGEAITIMKIIEYWESMSNYFREGLKFMDSMTPKIERYRKFIREIAQAPSAQVPTKLFKLPLQVVCKRENRRVPQIVVACCDYLFAQGLDTQGIFRVSPTKDHLDDLKIAIDEGRDYDFSDISNPHVISGLLKSFFRELPDPIFTFERYSMFMEAIKLEPAEQVKAIAKLLQTLPEPNYKSLHHLSKLCLAVNARKDENKMTITNLATVLTPNLLYTTNVDPLSMVQEMEQANKIYSLIVENYDIMFPVDDLAKDALVLPEKASSEASDSSATSSLSSTPTKLGATSVPLLSSSAPNTPSPLLSRSPGDSGLPAEIPDENSPIYKYGDSATGSLREGKKKPRTKVSTASFKIEGLSNTPPPLTRTMSHSGLTPPSSPKLVLDADGNETDAKRVKTPRSGRKVKAGVPVEAGETAKQISSLAAIEALKRSVSRSQSENALVAVVPEDDEDGNSPKSPDGTRRKKKKSPRSPNSDSLNTSTELKSSSENTIPPASLPPALTDVPTSSSKDKPAMPSMLPPPIPEKRPKIQIPPPIVMEQPAQEVSAPVVQTEPLETPKTDNVVVADPKVENTTETAQQDDVPPAVPVEDDKTDNTVESNTPEPETIETETETVQTETETETVQTETVETETVTEDPKPAEPTTTAETTTTVTPAAETKPTPPEPVEPVKESQIDDDEIQQLIKSAAEEVLSVALTQPDYLPSPASQLSVLLDQSITSTCEAISSFVRAAVVPSFGADEIASLSSCTREIAVQARSLFSASQMFSSNYPEVESDIISTSEKMQTLLRELVVAVKSVSTDPEEPTNKQQLFSKTAEFVGCMDSWINLMEGANVQQFLPQIKVASQKTTMHVSPILRAAMAQSIDDSIEAEYVDMKRDMHSLIDLLSMCGSLCHDPQHTKPLDEATDLIFNGVAKFWETAQQLSAAADPEEIGKEMYQNAKTLITTFKTIDQICTDCSDHMSTSGLDLSGLKSALKTAIGHLLNRLDYGTTASIDVRILATSCKQYAKSLAVIAAKWIDNTSPSGAELLDLMEKYQLALNQIVSQLKYHRLDQDAPSYLLGLATGAQINTLRMKNFAAMQLLEHTTSNESQIVAGMLRNIHLVNKSIFDYFE